MTIEKHMDAAKIAFQGLVSLAQESPCVLQGPHRHNGSQPPWHNNIFQCPIEAADQQCVWQSLLLQRDLAKANEHSHWSDSDLEFGCQFLSAPSRSSPTQMWPRSDVGPHPYHKSTGPSIPLHAHVCELRPHRCVDLGHPLPVPDPHPGSKDKDWWFNWCWIQVGWSCMRLLSSYPSSDSSSKDTIASNSSMEVGDSDWSSSSCWICCANPSTNIPDLSTGTSSLAQLREGGLKVFTLHSTHSRWHNCSKCAARKRVCTEVPTLYKMALCLRNAGNASHRPRIACSEGSSPCTTIKWILVVR